MDWSNTKTIFIITFLILDIFLAYQFAEKRNRSELDMITEAGIEEQLQTEEITYKELPKEPKEGTYISGKTKLFSINDIKNFKNQEFNLDNPAILKSVLKNPIRILEKGNSSKLDQFLKENIISGDSYKLWKIDEDAGNIILFQQYQDKIFYNNTSNLSGLLLINLNDNQEVTSYQQTMLVNFEEYDKKEILPALKALENLYKNDHLMSGSDVTNIELGYYPLEQLSESQILAPTWRIEVDSKVDYYVNAFEGQILEILE
jgi:regulatory protein YycI of two-component signal transduction system YycFG